MKRSHLLSVVAVLAAAVALPAGASASTPKAPWAKIRGPIVASADGSSATVRVSYRCNTGNHLWVSVKESGTGRKDWRLRDEGSSALAATWLYSHADPFTCDGTKRTELFQVGLAEPGSKGALVHGRAYVQFCLTQETDPLAEPQIVIYKTGFRWVHRSAPTTT
jgi:hypothetical protein